jgi:hypothetical protein
MESILGVTRATVSATATNEEIAKYTNGKISMPMNAVLFVSCDYQIEATTEYPTMLWARDIIVASKQVFSGELIEKYVLGSESYE